MKTDRTKFTAQYENGVVKAVWVSVDMIPDEGIGETPEAALAMSKDICDRFYSKHYPGLQINQEYLNSVTPISQPTELPVIKKEEDIKIGVTPEDIMNCDDLIVLESYRLIIKTNKELERAYMVRKEQLTQNNNNGK